MRSQSSHSEGVCLSSPHSRPEAGRRRAANTEIRRSSSGQDRKSTRLNSSHGYISYAVFCLKKKNTSSTSFAHPAISAERNYSPTFACIAPASYAPLLITQLAYGLAALDALRAPHHDSTAA